MSTSSFPTNHNAAFISLPYKITAHYHQAPSLLAVSNLLYYPLHKHPIQLKYCPLKSLQWPPTWFPLLHYSVAEGIRGLGSGLGLQTGAPLLGLGEGAWRFTAREM